MRVSPWRVESARVIETLLAEGQVLGLSGRDLCRHVSRGYPFGARKGHPYRVWLHECE